MITEDYVSFEMAKEIIATLEHLIKFNEPDEIEKEYIEEPKIAFGDWGDKEKKEAIITCLKYMRFIKKITNQEYDDLIKWLANNTISNVSEKEKCLRKVKQKEQNSVDEQFPPLNGLDAIKAKYYDDGFKNGFDEGVASVKPAEWSEEDEKDMAHIIRILDDCYVYGTHDLSKTDRENLVNKLKSLRPSWKPSEQEKGALRTAIHVLTDERNFPKAAAHLQNILNAFEGEESRKDWKPSEEQMKALSWLVEYVAPSEEYIILIKKLYEQLKKL